jgi:putative peptidoglycan lipid II flippase
MISKLINNKILNSRPTQSVAAAAFIISIAGILSRLLGLIRDRILATQFGAGDTLDVYYAAFRIPDLIYNLLILGALSAAFIPVFTGLISKNKEEAWELASGVINLAVISIVLLSAILSILAVPLLHLITPGFSEDKTQTAVIFTRIMFLSPLLLGISAIFGGILVSLKRFLVYSLAPIMYNVGIIIGALFFVKIMGPVGLAWGVVLGAGLHMLTQYPAVRSAGFSYKAILKKTLNNKNVRKILVLMIPRTMGLAVSQINLFIITIFASTLAAGSLAVFNFASNLQSVPLGIFSASFAIAVFPHLSHYHASDSRKKFVETFSKTLRRIIFFIVPISILIFVLRAQIVRVALGAGKFDWEDTIRTFQILGIMAISLFAQGLVPLLARSFYALHDTKTPFYIALVSEAVNILTVILFIGRMGVACLALAFSLSSAVNMILLFLVLRRKLGDLNDRRNLVSIVKIIIASLFAALVAQILKYYTDSVINIDTFLGIFSQLVIAGGAGILTYFLVSYVLKIEEFQNFRKSIMLKFFGQPADVVIDQDDER